LGLTPLLIPEIILTTDEILYINEVTLQVIIPTTIPKVPKTAEPTKLAAAFFCCDC